MHVPVIFNDKKQRFCPVLPLSLHGLGGKIAKIHRAAIYMHGINTNST